MDQRPGLTNCQMMKRPGIYLTPYETETCPLVWSKESNKIISYSWCSWKDRCGAQKQKKQRKNFIFSCPMKILNYWWKSGFDKLHIDEMTRYFHKTISHRHTLKCGANNQTKIIAYSTHLSKDRCGMQKRKSKEKTSFSPVQCRFWTIDKRAGLTRCQLMKWPGTLLWS